MQIPLFDRCLIVKTSLKNIFCISNTRNFTSLELTQGYMISMHVSDENVVHGSLPKQVPKQLPLHTFATMKHVDQAICTIIKQSQT